MFSELSKSAEGRPTGTPILFPLVVFVIALLTACTGQEPVPTPTPSPYPTTVIKSLTVPDLGSLLIDPIQLPTRVTSADINMVPHPAFADLPQADYFISALYTNGTEFGGRVSIFIYAENADLDTAWPLVLDTIYTPREIQGPGELTAVDHSDMAFIRCGALVHLKINGADADEILTFAEKLDADLVPLICP